jgi:membrane protease YdiL (CAAX protease family)
LEIATEPESEPPKPSEHPPAAGAAFLSDVLPVAAVLGVAFVLLLLDQTLLWVAWSLDHLVAGLLAASILGVLLPSVILCRLFGLSAWAGLSLKRLSRTDAGLALVVVATAFAPTYVLGMLAQRAFPPSEDAFALYEALLPRDPVSIVAGGFAVGAVAPLAEEVVFRALGLGGLARILPSGVAIAMQAVLFALVHGERWMLPPITVLGTLLGLLAWRTANLSSAWLAHGLFNLVAYVELCLTHDVRGARLERWSAEPWVLGPSIVGLVVALTCLARTTRPMPMAGGSGSPAET